MARRARFKQFVIQNINFTPGKYPKVPKQPCSSTAQRSSPVETHPQFPAWHGAQLSNLRGALQMSSPPCGASTPEPNGSTSPGNSSFRLPAVPNTSYLNPRIQPATGSSSPGKKEKALRSA